MGMTIRGEMAAGRSRGVWPRGSHFARKCSLTREWLWLSGRTRITAIRKPGIEAA